MRKKESLITQQQAAPVGAIIALSYIAVASLLLHAWITEAPFLTPRLFPAAAFIVSLILGWKVWVFFSKKFKEIGFVPFSSFISAIFLPLFILSVIEIIDSNLHKVVWKKEIAMIEDVQIIPRTGRKLNRREQADVTYRYYINGAVYTRKERINAVQFYDELGSNGTSSKISLDNQIPFANPPSGVFASESEIHPSHVGKMIDIRVHPVYNDRSFVQQPARLFIYFVAVLSFMVLIFNHQKKKSYV